MNLFITHKDPIKAAGDLDDKRVIKIILEATQVLSTALAVEGINSFYKPTHRNHPITLWAIKDSRNRFWILRYGLALCDVYRTFSKRKHACYSILREMSYHIRQDQGEPIEFQNSARRMDLGIDFSHLEVCTAYREYLNTRWSLDKRSPPVDK